MLGARYHHTVALTYTFNLSLICSQNILSKVNSRAQNTKNSRQIVVQIVYFYNNEREMQRLH